MLKSVLFKYLYAKIKARKNGQLKKCCTNLIRILLFNIKKVINVFFSVYFSF